MWRFFNNIPRTFRACHGHRASVGVHVDDNEQEGQQNQEICPQGRHEAKEDHEIGLHHDNHQDTASIGQEFVEDVRRRSCLIRGAFLGWNSKRVGFFRNYTSQGERTKQEKEEHWWEACRQDLCALLGRNYLLPLLAAVGACQGWNFEGFKDAAKKKLLYRVLFSLSRGNSATCYITGNILPAQLSPTHPEDKCRQDYNDIDTKVTDSVNSQISVDSSSSESIDSALSEFQDICNEYSSKSESLLGLESVENKDMTAAVEHLKKACNMGNISAYFNVGLCYETGSGVSKDLKKAVYYYERAARKGHSLAMYNLGLIYLNSNIDDGNYKDDQIDDLQHRGKLFIKEAADLGLAEAQTQMGILCMEQENAEDASEYFKAAAQQDDCEAHYFLAMCYEQGLGVQVDMERSIQLYSLAANAGHEGAIYNLAVFNELGWGEISANPIAAAELYQKAADAGHALAQSRLDELATEREEEQCHAQKRVWIEQQNESPAPYRQFSSDSSSSTLSSSASTPDLISHYSDITSLLFPQTTSNGQDKFSFISTPGKSSQRRDSGSFYIGEDINILKLKNLRCFVDSKDTESKDIELIDLSYPMYGYKHVHKSCTSPNLSAMVACNI